MKTNKLMINDWVNKLMINDWVLYEGEPYQIRQLGIYGVDRDGEDYPAVCIGKPKGIGLIVEINEISPIPLAVKILEKNGFIKNKYGEMILDDELGASEITYLVLVPFRDEVYYRWMVNNELIAVIKSVHELQHIMRVCKIDKEIEL